MRFSSLVLSAMLLAPMAAKADTLSFNVTGSASGFSGSGVFTGTSNSDGSFTITGISAPQFGAISVLAANNALYLNDNLFFPTSSSLVDARGIAFSGAFGTADLFSLGSSYFIRGFDLDNDAFVSPITLSLTNSTSVTPEPSSILLTFTGLLAGTALVFRKRLVASVAAAQPVL